MANPKHLKILKQGVEAWNLWRLTNAAHNRRVQDDTFSRKSSRVRRMFTILLYSGNLSAADLSGADLSSVDLSSINLAGADLSDADLNGADLSDANLDNVDLSGASLGNANFHNASISGANFSGSWMGRTSLADLDLRKAEGLEKVIHLAPSSIGTDTLFKSRGQISEVFLRGCGVPESVLTRLPLLVASGGFYSCFISYSHSDKSYSRRLHDQLQARGIRC